MDRTRLTRLLFEKFPHLKISLIDAGADAFRDGRTCWEGIGKSNIILYAFDGDGCEQKNHEARDNDWNHHYYPVIVSDKNGLYPFHIYKCPPRSSVFPPNKKLSEILRYDHGEPMDELNSVVETKILQHASLDSYWEIDEFDFLKMNIEGAELLALEGFGGGIKDCLGVEIELAFLGLRDGAPYFSDIDPILREKGLTFFDLLAPNVAGYKNSFIHYHPDRVLANHNFPKKHLTDAHFLYLRNPLTEGYRDLDSTLKLAIISEGYGQVEFAFAVLENWPGPENFNELLQEVAQQYVG